MKIRKIAEKIIYIVLATMAIAVSIIDSVPFGIDLLEPDQIAAFSLFILGTITVVVFMEISRLHVIDDNAKLLESIDQKTTHTQKLLHAHYSGIHSVHEEFPSDYFKKCIPNAKKIKILNTWIPNLRKFTNSLIKAINNGTEVNILLLYPRSAAAELRSEALQSAVNPVPPDNVQRGVEENLSLLAYIFQKINSDKRDNLKVKMFNSLPSVSIYQADELTLVGMYFHGELAIHTPQLEVDENSSGLGQSIEKEFEILWDIGHEITNIEDWRKEVDLMAGRV